MTRSSLVAGVAAAAFLAVMSAAPVSAHTYDKLTYLTFSGPIQIPGVTLDAGTYRFHLADPSSGRSVVQVLSNDGAVVYAMFHTIPDIRMTVTGEATVTFREAPVGVAPPVKTLFYGGETRGYEFIYPRGGPNMIPRVTPLPEITYTPIVAEAAPPVIEPEPVVAEAAPVEPVVEPIVEPVESLPATGSPVPLAALGGLASMVAGLGLRLRRRHHG
jgi:LPXTG-motif cell wall-anchored protein